MGARNSGMGMGGVGGATVVTGDTAIGALPFAVRGDGGGHAVFINTDARDDYYDNNPGELLATKLAKGLEAVCISPNAPDPAGMTTAYVRNSTNTDWTPIAANFIGPKGDKGEATATNTIEMLGHDEQVGGTMFAKRLNFRGDGVTLGGETEVKYININALKVRGDDDTDFSPILSLIFRGPGLKIGGAGFTRAIDIDPLRTVGENKIPEKTTPLAGNDRLLVADSEDGHIKKSVKYSKLLEQIAQAVGGT